MTCNLSQGIKENAMQQGRQQGLQQGRQQGLQQGAQQARIEAVAKMVRANIPEQTIRSMGYTEEELSSAKQKI
jgi:flagellar biosynthesis/type III secretory pathway protein FliH